MLLSPGTRISASILGALKTWSSDIKMFTALTYRDSPSRRRAKLANFSHRHAGEGPESHQSDRGMQKDCLREPRRLITRCPSRDQEPPKRSVSCHENRFRKDRAL